MKLIDTPLTDDTIEVYPYLFDSIFSEFLRKWY